MNIIVNLHKVEYQLISWETTVSSSFVVCMALFIVWVFGIQMHNK